MPIELTNEDLAKLQDKQLANVLRKLNSGKTLTAREETILARARTSEPSKFPPGAWQGVLFEPAETHGRGAFAQNWSELAAALSQGGVPITRRAIQEWRRDPRYMADCPPDRPDGRKDVAAWFAFMVRNGLKRADDHVPGKNPAPDYSENIPDADGDGPKVIQPPPIGGCAADWNKAKAMVEYERDKLKLETQRGTLLVASELEVPLGATFVVMSQKWSQFPERIAPQVAGFVDVPEIISIVRTEVESDLGELHGARYLDVTVNGILDELPFDAESARLLQLVSFEGQDKRALRELIARVALETLRTIGARAISETTNGDSGSTTTKSSVQSASKTPVQEDVPESRPASSDEDLESSAQTASAPAQKGKAGNKALPKKGRCARRKSQRT